MNAYLKAPMTLALVLAVPLFARPALGAPAQEPVHRPRIIVSPISRKSGRMSARQRPFGGRLRPTVSAATPRSVAEGVASTTEGELTRPGPPASQRAGLATLETTHSAGSGGIASAASGK
jgi:hypothetical protein